MSPARKSGDAIAAGKAHRRKTIAAGLVAAAMARRLGPFAGIWVLPFYATQAAPNKTSEV
jgi:hypothetical protein